MYLQIHRKDGSVEEVSTGAMRLIAQVKAFGKADVVDQQSGTKFQVELSANGNLVECSDSPSH